MKLLESIFFAGQESDNALMLTNVSTVRSDHADNPIYSTPNQPAGDGVVYEDIPSGNVAVRAPVVTAFTSDECYSKLRRDSSVLSQSITIDDHDDVEAYYGRLDSTEQYIVSIVCCGDVPN